MIDIVTGITDNQLIRYLDGLGVELPDHQLFLPSEVAELFRVDTRTVNRWGKEKRLTSVPTPGGHGRYARREVMDMLKETLAVLIEATLTEKEVTAP